MIVMDELKEANPVRLLIVDDHPNTAAMLARVLSKFETPVEIITASGGEEAIKMIGDRGVDILITDFMMPGVNGLELIERLKGSQKPAHIILITAYDTPGLAVSARRLNVQDYLVKPVQPEKIRGIVGKVIDELRPTFVQRKQDQFKREFKILVADDNPDNLRLLSSRLQNEGYLFTPAWDGDETLGKIRAEQPDLILLDVNMPKKDGFQVLEEIRADPALAHIPVIIISAARIGPKDIREGLTLGADDYVIKPFDWRELAARIQSKLRVKQAEDILRNRNMELELLEEISQQLVNAGNLEDVAEIVLRFINRAVASTWARLDVLHEQESIFNCIQCCAAQKKDPPDILQDRFLHLEVISNLIANPGILMATDLSADPKYQELQDAGIGSLAVVPLLKQNHLVGLLCLANTEKLQYLEEKRVLLQTIASQAALAIENIQNLETKSQLTNEMAKLRSFLTEKDKEFLISETFSRSI